MQEPRFAHSQRAQVKPTLLTKQGEYGNSVKSFKVKMGTTLFLILSLAQISCGPKEPEAKAQDHPKPVFFLYEEVGLLLDSPQLGLYENGLLIYSGDSDRPTDRYRSGKLGEAALQELLVELDIETLAQLPKEKMEDDCPHGRTTMVFWLGEEKHKLTIHGEIEQAESNGEEIHPALLKAYRKLKGLQPDSSETWQPQEVLVFMVPVEDASEKDTPWPKEWPSFEDPKTLSREGVTILHFDHQAFESFIDYWESSDVERPQFSFNNQRWICLSFYAPLPGETLPF